MLTFCIDTPKPSSIHRLVMLVCQPSRWCPIVWISVVHVAQHDHSKFMLKSLLIWHLKRRVFLSWLGLSLLLLYLSLLLRWSCNRSFFDLIRSLLNHLVLIGLRGVSLPSLGSFSTPCARHNKWMLKAWPKISLSLFTNLTMLYEIIYPRLMWSFFIRTKTLSTLFSLNSE